MLIGQRVLRNLEPHDPLPTKRLTRAHLHGNMTSHERPFGLNHYWMTRWISSRAVTTRAGATGGAMVSTRDKMLRAHSDVLLLVHVVFSTLERRPLLSPAMDAWLHAVLRNLSCRNGAELL